MLEILMHPGDDAERRERHSHAERGNETPRGTSVPRQRQLLAAALGLLTSALNRDLRRAALLRWMNFFDAAWSSFLTAVLKAVSMAAASPAFDASLTFRITDRSEVRAARFRNRRRFAWRMALAALRLLGMAPQTTVSTG